MIPLKQPTRMFSTQVWFGLSYSFGLAMAWACLWLLLIYGFGLETALAMQ